MADASGGAPAAPPAPSVVAGSAPGAGALTGERLEQLLAAVAAASDHRAAAALLVETMAASVGARSAAIWTLDVDSREFERVATVGGAGALPAALVSVADDRHPLVVSGMSLWALSCAGASDGEQSMPAGAWALVPL